MTMNDCIDRQTVHYYIESHINEIITESGVDKNEHTNRMLRALVNGVDTMPSVTPTVIEDIKAEINEGIENYKHKDKAVMYGFMCALYIIDKHVEGWDK